MNNVEIIYYVLRGICVYCTSRGLRATISRKKSSSKIIFVDLFVNIYQKDNKKCRDISFLADSIFSKIEIFWKQFFKIAIGHTP